MPTVEAPDPPEDANAAAKPAPATTPENPAVKKKSPNSSPKKAGNGGTTSASAPAKAKAGEKKKPEPTLLQDFLRGRPTAGRPTATRPRRKSSGIAHAEVKMSAVNKLTPPAKVKNRVMEWQKASKGALAPEVTDLEEPMVVKQEDIKLAARSQSAGPRKEASPARPPVADKQTLEPAAPTAKPKTARKPKKTTLETPMPPTARGAQMKRVVSDTHWVNKAAKKETPVVKDPIFNLLLNSGAVKKAATTKPSPPKPATAKTAIPKKLPKDFTETNWANPPVERKIQDWVQRTSAEASANGHEEEDEAVKAYEEAVKEAQKSRSSPAKLEVPGVFKATDATKQPTPELKGRISREDTKKERPADAAKDKTAGLPKKPEEKKERLRRVRAARPEEIAAALGLPPPGRKSPKQRRYIDKKYDADDHRRLPSYGAGRNNGRDTQLYHDEDGAPYRNESYDRSYKYTSRRDSSSPDDFDDSTITSLDDRESPRRQISKPQQRRPRDEETTVTADTLSTLTSDSETTEAPRRQESRRQPRKTRDEKTTVTADTLSTLTSDSESTLSDTASIHRDDMRRGSKRSLRPKKSLEEIPVGYSAFSVLDLSPGGQPRSRPAKPLRKASLGVPNVLKRVYNEGMKIMQDTVDPPQIVVKNPPNIENWLNNTTDPFLDDPAKLPAGSQRKPGGQEKPLREKSQSYKAPNPTGDGPTGDGIPTRTISRPKSSHRNYADRDRRDQLRKSSLTDTIISESTVLENNQDLNGLIRRPARRETSSPFKERKSTRDLRSPQPGRDLNSYADSLSRDSDRHSRTQPRSQEFERVKSVEPLASDRRPSPRIDEQTSRHSLKEKKSDHGVRQTAELTSHGRLRRIPSNGPVGRAARRQDRSSTLKPQESMRKPSSGQPSRYVSSRALEGPGLKRRLTKHSDLMSMLSLPDTNVQRGASIASARSIRTKRAPLDSRDISLILSEVTADEAKYMRELSTLVDGVIPVLLSSVLARSNSVADSRSSPSTDAASTSITKSVVEMGDALKKLKTLHTQIPLESSEHFINWLLSAHAAYTEYLNAWRLGFDDIVVNLAPVTHQDNDSILPQKSAIDTETMEVAYLLRRPNARVKYLAKAAKGLSLANPTRETELAASQYEALKEHERRRAKEELARKQDMLANNTDVSRARDLRTLAPANNVRIDQTRQVKAKDYFGLSLSHSNGQRLACEVELIVRDSPDGEGDVLICEVDDHCSAWLLFPPVEMSDISARQEENKEDLVVMIRGHHDGKGWAEIFTLHAEDADIAQEFMELVGFEPMPPYVTNKADRPSTPITPKSAMMSGGLQEGSMDYPIGEAAPKRVNGMLQSSAARWESSTAADHVYERDADAAKAQIPKEARRSPSTTISQPSSPIAKPSSKDDQPSQKLRPQAKRRPSSPLKKEYNPDSQPVQRQQQPSVAYTSDSYDSYSESELTDSEFEDEIPVAAAAAAVLTQESTPRSTPPPPEGYCHKFTGYITCWRPDLGQFQDLYEDICSIRVMPGKVMIMIMDASHSAPYKADEGGAKQPLFELDLNPLSVLAQRTGLDVEIRAAQMETSLLRVNGYIRVRSADTIACVRLYRALEQARKDNAAYNQLEQERIVNGYGQHPQEETAEEFQSRKSWFGRKKSYRASARAPTVDSSSSKFSFGNAFTALDRFKKDNRSFNIEKSSVRSGGIFGRNRSSRASSQYANEDTLSNGFTPPHTSYDPSLATTGTIDTTRFDTTFMKIRLYAMYSRSGQWVDMGECQITISPAPEWMKASSNLYNGYQKRVTLTEIPEERALDKINKRFNNVLGSVDHRVPEVKFDEIVGARCCAMAGRKGIVMQIWEQLRGANGEVGRAPAEGGVCGRQQKYLLQSESTAQARFIFALLGAGGGAGYEI